MIPGLFNNKTKSSRLKKMKKTVPKKIETSPLGIGRTPHFIYEGQNNRTVTKEDIVSDLSIFKDFESPMSSKGQSTIFNESPISFVEQG